MGRGHGREGEDREGKWLAGRGGGMAGRERVGKGNGRLGEGREGKWQGGRERVGRER